MRSLVVYYSRSGNTKKVAVAISRMLKSDMEEIIDTKDRSGIMGWWLAGGDAFLKKPTVIKRIKSDPKKYRVVIIGTPIWAVNMAPAVRTYITKMKKRFKKVAFFCTKGGVPPKNAFNTMKELCGKPPFAILDLNERDIRNGDFYEMVKKFANRLKYISSK
jgi:flavodoxin